MTDIVDANKPAVLASGTALVRLALPVPLNRLFDYTLPLGMIQDLGDESAPLVGRRVLVSFGPRELVGLIVEQPESSEVPPEKLKPIKALLDISPSIEPNLLALARQSSQYYHHPLGDVLSLFLPPRVKSEKSVSSASAAKCLALTHLAPAPESVKGKRQQQLLTFLRENGPTLIADRPSNISSATVKALIEKGWIEEQAAHTTAKQLAPFLQLNTQQQQVYQHIKVHADAFAVHLLHGVTGSGKTEVYLHCIADCLAKGQQALVLVPEIGLTPQTISRFAERFPEPVLAYHSEMTPRQRFDVWHKVKAGFAEAAIVIGTRSASFLPFPNLGMIVVDEEHDQSFKQQDGFRYSARDFAILRAKQHNIAIILGSATPTLESLHNCHKDHYHYLKLEARANAAVLPKVELIDARKSEMKEGIACEVIEQTRKHLARNEQVLYFINRRGFSPLLTCHDCAWTADCRDCDAKMTLHLQPPHLHCHHCLRTAPIPQQCPDCGSEKIVYLGAGTERTEQSLIELFPEFRTLRVDRDNVQGQKKLNQALSDIAEQKVDIIIGTQMLAKGHHFPNITLVVILNIDVALFASDYRAPERAAQLVAQVAGRAGRGDKPGKVLIQTHHPEEPVLNFMQRHDYQGLTLHLLENRQMASYPPYSYHALFRAEHRDEDSALQLLEIIKMQSHARAGRSISLMGPVPAPLSRRSGRHRFNLLIQSKSRSTLHRHLNFILRQLAVSKLAQKVRWSLDVDPQDMM